MIGASAVAVPGNLRGWTMMHQAHGRLPFADVIEPAIRTAARGYAATPYLNGAIKEHAADLALDAEIARILLPGGAPVAAGSRVVMSDYADSLRLVQREGAAALHGGELGRALIARLATGGADAGHLTLDDLVSYRAIERQAIFGSYRGHTIAGPPPPASSGVHVAQMLNMLEAYDVAGMGFGSVENLHLLAEVIRVAFEDRRAASGDPDFVDVPVEKFTSKAYAAEARARMRDIGGATAAPIGLRKPRHHPCHRRRPRRQYRRRHPYAERPVRRPHHGARHRHHPQQLHAELRSASRAGRCRSRRARGCRPRWRR